MNKPRLLLLNTIGLTGVELLLAELARMPEVLALPGQNFGFFEHNLYRPHDYSRYSPERIFQTLNHTLYTKEGRIWMGLTKHMPDVEKKAYSEERHQQLFVARLGSSREFLDAVEAFILAFFEGRGIDLSHARYLTWFSNNVLLNHRHYPRFAERARVLHLGARIDRWLAIISQTRTWDCAAACKFWLLNSLCVQAYASQHPNSLALYVDDLIDAPDAAVAKVREFLGLSGPVESSAVPPLPAYIRRDAKMLAVQTEGAAELRRIYRDYSYFQLADSFEEWAPEFARRPRVQQLLERFEQFWNSTSHTNFDWIGPVGDEIMDELLEFAPRRDGRNFNFTFYHQYFALASDTYDRPVARLEHFLGCLEDDLVIPKLPYYLKVAMEYLISVSKNNIKLHHSYISLRNGSLYRRLVQPDYQAKINQFGLGEKMRETERYLTEAETTCTGGAAGA